MTWTLVLEPNETSSGTASGPGAAASSISPERYPDNMPAFVPSNQLYYWTGAWRRGEEESLADLAAGRALEFVDPIEAVRYLLSPDDA